MVTVSYLFGTLPKSKICEANDLFSSTFKLNL
jgi:hypothetical protein